ncbi:MAG: TIM barrel protein [Fidelibacterota bacterium]|nr:MAG: TIM barrel protein [Candidatus Neomarinimicrobiota bacterium]
MTSKPKDISRREFLTRGSQAAMGIIAGSALVACGTKQPVVRKPPDKLQLGFVTYQWGRDWDLPTLIRNCQKTGVLAVELRTQHAHGVDSHINARQRYEVKIRFENSPVTLVGLGTNWAFHYVDPAKLREDIKGAKEYVKLSYDVGGSGVKIKPNALPEEVPVEKTIEQIGQSLNDLGRFAADYGQEIRVEVHGNQTSELPVMKQIFDVVNQPNVGVCWNCNRQDLEGEGLEHNFNLVKDHFGETAHIRELDGTEYPYQELIQLFVGMDYKGWLLLEARREVPDRVKALAEQAALFKQMVAEARARV